MKLKVVTYNIHKGFSYRNKRFVLKQIKESLKQHPCDIVFLQEVVGSSGLDKHNSQFEFLADEIWSHYSYGKNAVIQGRHHGNAILSKYPIIYTHNLNLSLNKHELRGMIHAIIEIPQTKEQVHILCTHLSLLESHRKKQVKKINAYIKKEIPADAPLIMGGDFNDWSGKSYRLLEGLNLKEAFIEYQGFSPKTFPSTMPLLRLDRIFTRYLIVQEAVTHDKSPWDKLSDHLPISATLLLDQ